MMRKRGKLAVNGMGGELICTGDGSICWGDAAFWESVPDLQRAGLVRWDAALPDTFGHQDLRLTFLGLESIEVEGEAR
jgi:hypothetical protein